MMIINAIYKPPLQSSVFMPPVHEAKPNLPVAPFTAPPLGFW